MNEKELLNLMNSMDDDLIDKKIDEFMSEKGECININNIKEKALNKMNNANGKRCGLKRKYAAAVLVAATVTISTVYAGDISNTIKSFINKSQVYSTVVDGDAFVLTEELRLDDDYSLTDVSVTKGDFQVTVKSNKKIDDGKVSHLNISAVAKNKPNVKYTAGGYSLDENRELMFLLFMNETENNYNIEPFKDFTFNIGGKSFDVSLSKAESVKVDNNIAIGSPEPVANSTVSPQPVTAATIGANAIANNGNINIQLLTSFKDGELELGTIGEPVAIKFQSRFENQDNGILSSGTSSMANPIKAFDESNNEYTLVIPKDSKRSPVTIFETTAKLGTPLTVKVPAVTVNYRKEVASGVILNIPKEGEAVINKELDFIIQKAVAKSIKRIDVDKAVVTFELNTGADKSIFITDMGVYSKNVKNAETVIEGNTAVMTMTFEKGVETVDFRFSWPYYVIRGNWSIELNKTK